jgi:parallel beta-helix repeat protein
LVKSDTVKNGLVANFATGVEIDGATDTVSSLRSVANVTDGFLDVGQGTQITNSVASRNGYVGIDSYAPGSTYSGDQELSNDFGIALVGAQNVAVSDNVANGNSDVGIYEYGVATTLTKNTANFNGGDGIYVFDVAVIDGGGNTAKDNDYAPGQVNEQCHGIVCQRMRSRWRRATSVQSGLRKWTGRPPRAATFERPEVL